MIADQGLAERWRTLEQRIAAAATRANRDPKSVKIMAVTKTRDRENVERAIQAGVTLLGENRVQEAHRKFADAPLPANVELHLIGQLQRNKVRQALQLFNVVESVDRSSLIEALAREADQVERVVPVMIQINVAGEQQKAGCSPDMIQDLARSIDDAGNLHLTGLMTIAPLVDDPESVRPVFREMCRIAERLRDRVPSLELSMGMSNDLDVAVEEGATIVRAGRALFSTSVDQG